MLTDEPRVTGIARSFAHSLALTLSFSHPPLWQHVPTSLHFLPHTPFSISRKVPGAAVGAGLGSAHPGLAESPAFAPMPNPPPPLARENRGARTCIQRTWTLSRTAQRPVYIPERQRGSQHFMRMAGTSCVSLSMSCTSLNPTHPPSLSEVTQTIQV